VIILDTHVWVWWVSSSQSLSPKARAIVDQNIDEGGICVSSISAWEVALLVDRRRLELTMQVEDWIAKSEALPFLRFVGVDNQIAVRSVRLPGDLHDDPADRMIVATAQILGVPLVTKDENLHTYPHVETIW
jgi:PIN domain nuclease of toxin-antitoxin system